jgi:hypothetical protein
MRFSGRSLAQILAVGVTVRMVVWASFVVMNGFRLDARPRLAIAEVPRPDRRRDGLHARIDTRPICVIQLFGARGVWGFFGHELSLRCSWKGYGFVVIECANHARIDSGSCVIRPARKVRHLLCERLGQGNKPLHASLHRLFGA